MLVRIMEQDGVTREYESDGGSTVTMRNQPNVREGSLCNARRHHQGLANRLISPEASDSGKANGPVHCRQRLGGMLNFYCRRAA